MQRLAERQHQPERAAVGVGESLSGADAALAGDLAPVRRPVPRALHAGMDAVGHRDVHDVAHSGLGPDGLHSRERQRRPTVAGRVLVAGPEPDRHEHQSPGRPAVGSLGGGTDPQGVGVAGPDRSPRGNHHQRGVRRHAHRVRLRHPALCVPDGAEPLGQCDRPAQSHQGRRGPEVSRRGGSHLRREPARVVEVRARHEGPGPEPLLRQARRHGGHVIQARLHDCRGGSVVHEQR